MRKDEGEARWTNRQVAQMNDERTTKQAKISKHSYIMATTDNVGRGENH